MRFSGRNKGTAADMPCFQTASKALACVTVWVLATGFEGAFVQAVPLKEVTPERPLNQWFLHGKALRC